MSTELTSPEEESAKKYHQTLRNNVNNLILLMRRKITGLETPSELFKEIIQQVERAKKARRQIDQDRKTEEFVNLISGLKVTVLLLNIYCPDGEIEVDLQGRHWAELKTACKGRYIGDSPLNIPRKIISGILQLDVEEVDDFFSSGVKELHHSLDEIEKTLANFDPSYLHVLQMIKENEATKFWNSVRSFKQNCWNAIEISLRRAMFNDPELELVAAESGTGVKRKCMEALQRWIKNNRSMFQSTTKKVVWQELGKVIQLFNSCHSSLHNAVITTLKNDSKKFLSNDMKRTLLAKLKVIPEHIKDSDIEDSNDYTTASQEEVPHAGISFSTIHTLDDQLTKLPKSYRTNFVVSRIFQGYVYVFSNDGNMFTLCYLNNNQE